MATEKQRRDLFDALYPKGQRYVFIFKQGFKKTNIQAVEFLYLLQMHTVLSSSDARLSLQIISSSDIAEASNQYLPAMERARTDEERERIRVSLSKFYSNKAVVDFNMTSAILFMPDTARVDFAAIVAESGYIHSFGNLIESGELQELAAGDLEESLRYAVEIGRANDAKTMIVPYCHEDFSTRDRKKSMFLSDGLDDIKFHISKAYIGQEKLYKFLSDFCDKNPEDACLAPTNYQRSREVFAEKFPDCQVSTVWIITDFLVRSDELSSSNKKILISYRQIYKNENFYHFYEENKPAWASHTTLPHTLAGAMINLARRWLPEGDVRICDPFSGSGTVFLEAQKFTGLRCSSYDLSYLNVEVLADNIAFFQQDASGLRKIVEELDQLGSANASDPITKAGHPNHALKQILEVVKEWRDLVSGEDFLTLDEDAVKKGLDRISPKISHRIALYCALRATVRGSVDFDRDIATWDEVFKREIGDLKIQVLNHIDELDQMGGRIQKDSVTEGMGSYSTQLLPPAPAGLSEDLFSLKEFSVADVANLPEGLFDAIICDPPYGFNTDEDRIEIIEFADLLVRKLVEGLKPEGGQIIMALPRVSFTGREIPLALRSDQVARRVIDYCLDTGRQCWKPALVFPCPITDFIGVPYYWKSEKALVRRILHFWIVPSDRFASVAT